MPDHRIGEFIMWTDPQKDNNSKHAVGVRGSRGGALAKITKQLEEKRGLVFDPGHIDQTISGMISRHNLERDKCIVSLTFTDRNWNDRKRWSRHEPWWNQVSRSTAHVNWFNRFVYKCLQRYSCLARNAKRDNRKTQPNFTKNTDLMCLSLTREQTFESNHNQCKTHSKPSSLMSSIDVTALAFMPLLLERHPPRQVAGGSSDPHYCLNEGGAMSDTFLHRRPALVRKWKA